MRGLIRAVAMIVAACFTMAGVSQAAMVFLTPADSTFSAPVSAGTFVTIGIDVTFSADDLAGNNLGDGGFGGFQAGITWDPSLLSLSNVTLGSDLSTANSSLGTNFGLTTNLQNSSGLLRVSAADSTAVGVPPGSLSAGTYELATFHANLLSPLLAPSTTTTALLNLVLNTLPGPITYPAQINDDQGTSYTLSPAPTNGQYPRDALITVNAVPEPSTLVSVGIGGLLLGLAVLRRRRS